jgi:hypothetical protein
MNSSYFTEEHQLFRESLKDFYTKEVVPHRKMGKTGQLNASYGKSLEKWAFWYNYPEVYGGLNLDLFLFSRRTSKD